MALKIRTVSCSAITVLILQSFGCSLPPEKSSATLEKSKTDMEILEQAAKKTGRLKADGYIDNTFQKHVFALRNPTGECPAYYLYRKGRNQVNWSSNTTSRGWNGSRLDKTAKPNFTKNGVRFPAQNNNLFDDTIHKFGRDSYTTLINNSIYHGKNGGDGKRVLVVNIDSAESMETEKRLTLSGLDFNLILFSTTSEGQENVRNILCSKNPQGSWKAFKSGKKLSHSANCTYDEKAVYDAQCMLGGAPVLVRSDGKSSIAIEDMIEISKEQDLPDIHIERYKMGISRTALEQSLPKEICKSMGEWIKCKPIYFDKNRYDDGWIYSDGWYDKICEKANFCQNEMEIQYSFMLHRKIYFAGIEVEQANFSFDKDHLAIAAIALRDTEPAKAYLTRTAGAPNIVTDYQIENKSIHTVRPIMIGNVATVEHDFYPTQTVRTSRIYQWNSAGYYAELEGNILKIAAKNRRP